MEDVSTPLPHPLGTMVDHKARFYGSRSRPSSVPYLCPQAIVVGWNPLEERNSPKHKTGKAKKGRGERLTSWDIASIMVDRISSESGSTRLSHASIAMSNTAIVVPHGVDGSGSPWWREGTPPRCPNRTTTRPKLSTIATHPYQQRRRCGCKPHTMRTGEANPYVGRRTAERKSTRVHHE